MSTLQEVEQAALAFSRRDRAVLAQHLLHSHPASFDEEEDDLVVARQRDAELESDPSIGLNLEQFKAAIVR